MAWPENFLRYVTGHSKQSCECSSPSPLLPVHVAHFLLEQIHFATSFLCWRILDAMRHPYVSAMEMRNRYQEESSSLLLLLRPPLTGSLSCEIRFYSRAPTRCFLLEGMYIYIYSRNFILCARSYWTSSLDNFCKVSKSNLNRFSAVARVFFFFFIDFVVI